MATSSRGDYGALLLEYLSRTEKRQQIHTEDYDPSYRFLTGNISLDICQGGDALNLRLLRDSKGVIEHLNSRQEFLLRNFGFKIFRHELQIFAEERVSLLIQ